jgi:hypothetical protein
MPAVSNVPPADDGLGMVGLLDRSGPAYASHRAGTRHRDGAFALCQRID